MTRDELLAKMLHAVWTPMWRVEDLLDVVLAAGDRRWLCEPAFLGLAIYPCFEGSEKVGTPQHKKCREVVVLPASLGDTE